MSHSLESLMRESALEAPRNPVALQLLTFLAIGMAAAIGFVGLSSLTISLITFIPNWIVSAVCYALFVVPVYLLHRRFTFASDTPHSHALPRYVAVQVTALALATIFSYIAYGTLGLPAPLAALLVIGLTSGVNFVVLRAWAFANR